MRPPLPVVSIFDVEGTLVDCVPLQLESWRATLNSAGHSFTHADLQPFSGMDGMWMLDQLLPEEPANTKQRLLKAQGESYRSDFILRAEPFPGVQRLFEELKQHDVLIGIATTCQKDELAAYDKRLGILELTDAVSWRWVFYINLPFGLLAMAAIRWGLPSERSERRASAFDYVGTAVFAAVISALLVGLIEAGTINTTAAKVVAHRLDALPLRDRVQRGTLQGDRG